MRTFFLLIIFFFLFTNKSDAQLFDTIQTSFTYKPKLLLKLDTRSSFITNQYTKISGIKIGLSYANTSRFGVGYHWMRKRLVKASMPDVDSVNLKFGYGIGFFEYNFFKTKHWNAEIPVQIGIGNASYNNKLSGSKITDTWVVIYEPAMTIEYKFLRYFGIGGGVGFRLAIKTNQNVMEKFTAPEYIFRFKIYFGDIYKEQILKE